MRHDGHPTVRTPRRAGAVALGIAAGMLAAIAASSAIEADASASWSGPKLTTTPMRAADAAAIDKLAQEALATD
jgi:hypothetical protein